MKKWNLLGAMILSAGLLSGCAGYQSKMEGTIGALQTGNISNALADLESNNTSKDKDLLYYFEKGELLRMKGAYDSSRDEWLIADSRVRAWEDQAKSDPSKLLGSVGSVLINDTTRLYEGRDFEKVFLNVRLALDHLALGNWGDARVEITKMHEREAIISEFRSKELEAAKKTAAEKGLKVTSFKELNGYPVETLQDPAVAGLKNSYESAFANYLAGFVYEALGEASLAAPGYRKAAEMRPNDPVIDAGLSGLDRRMKGGPPKMVDTLFIVETGTAPAIKSKTIPIVLPIPGKNGLSLIATPISWPVITPSDTSILPSNISVNGQLVPVSLLTNVDVMARRALSDEMPGIIVRSSIRAITKGIAQKAIDDNSGQMGLAGIFVSLAAKIATVASEVADERGWRSLPGFFSIGRMQLPEGTHKISLQMGGGVYTKEVQVSGRYAVVCLRTSGSNLYLAQSPYTPTAAAQIAENTEHSVLAVPKTKSSGSKAVSKTALKPAAKPIRSTTQP